jgi:hypothetical protein
MNVHYNCLEIQFIGSQKSKRRRKKSIPKKQPKVHVWSSISYHGTVGFHSFQNSMENYYYIEILENNFISNVKRQFNNQWRLQQDNDPPSTDL